MKVHSVTLPPTKVHPIRRASFVRIDQDTGMVGILEIAGQRREEANLYTSRYAVKELYDHKGRERHFKLTKPKGEETYYVCLTSDPDMHDVCCCIAYEKSGRCRHLEALRELQERQCLDVPQPKEEG